MEYRTRRRKNQNRSRILKLYGLSLEEVLSVIKSQGCACAICGRGIAWLGSASRDGQAFIDHDHEPPHLVRGALCFACNTGLGDFSDSPEVLKSAIAYLASGEVVVPGRFATKHELPPRCGLARQERGARQRRVSNDRRLVRDLGINLRQRQWLWNHCGQACGICGKHLPLAGGSEAAAHVDHSHKTNEIRGILCSRHNTGLGRLSDDPAIISKAIAYLENPPYNSFIKSKTNVS